MARDLEVQFGMDGQGRNGSCWPGRTLPAPSVRKPPGRRPPGWRQCRLSATALLSRQHAFAQPPGLVADGRDMGTVVFPGSPLKIYLTASPEERARRRHKQLKDKGLTVTIAGLSQEIRERDLRDSSRPVAPLRPAEDAVILDSTGLTIEQVVDQVLALARSRLPAIS